MTARKQVKVKPTKAWALVGPDGVIRDYGVRERPSMARAQAYTINHWKQAYAEGWRVIPVEIRPARKGKK